MDGQASRGPGGLRHGPGRAGGPMTTSQKSRAVAAAPESAPAAAPATARARSVAGTAPAPTPEAAEAAAIEALRRQVIALAADQQPGRPGRRRLPRAEQRPDADPQLRQAGPAQSRPGLSRAGADPDRRGGAAGGDDHAGHARPVAAGREPRPPRADRPGPAGRGSVAAGREGHGQAPRPAGREARRASPGRGSTRRRSSRCCSTC